MTNVQSLFTRCFIYSAEEEALRIKLQGQDASFGTVMVHGVPKRYTSIVTVNDLPKIRSDAKVLIRGDIRKISYKAPEKRSRS